MIANAISHTTTMKKFRKSYRVWKAYSVTLSVLGSYIWLRGIKFFRGQKWYEIQITKLHLHNAEKVKNALLDLEGLFIKVGQLLSILSNFLPEDFQRPLETLQNRLPERPYEEVKRRIVQELGRTPEEIFQSFDTQPLATASIGQAHRAVLKDGTKVVVKVQHYGIEQVAEIDLEIIKRLTAFISWWMNIRGMDYLYTQIKQMIEEELDFSKEAKSANRIRENLKSEEKIVIPTIHPEYSTAKVLTTTFCSGVKIADTESLDKMGIPRDALIERVFDVWCKMILRDGYYHADPHPGNLLVQADGTLVILDFGATASVSANMRSGISGIIEAAIKSDSDTMVEACRKMGIVAEGREAEKMAKQIIAALRNFLQNEVKVEGLNFQDISINPFNNSLSDLIQDIGFNGIAGTVQIPKDYVLLNRALMLLLGISNTVAPGFNPLTVVRPHVRDYFLREQGGLTGAIRAYAQRALSTAIALPDDLQRSLRKLRGGEIEINSPDTLAAARILATAIRRLTFAIVAIGLVSFQPSLPLAYKPWIWAVAGLLALGAVWPLNHRKH